MHRVRRVFQQLRPSIGGFRLLLCQMEDANTRNTMEFIAINFVNPSLSLETLVQTSQLPQTHCCLKVRQLEVETDAHMNIVAACAPNRPSLILQFSEAAVDRCITRCDNPALAGCNGLIGRERKAPRPSQCSEEAAFASGKKGLRRIFHNGDSVLRAMLRMSKTVPPLPLTWTGMTAFV